MASSTNNNDRLLQFYYAVVCQKVQRRGVGLSMLKKLIKCKTDVFGNLTEQDWGDVSALMKWNSCAAACAVAELFV